MIPGHTKHTCGSLLVKASCTSGRILLGINTMSFRLMVQVQLGSSRVVWRRAVRGKRGEVRPRTTWPALLSGALDVSMRASASTTSRTLQSSGDAGGPSRGWPGAELLCCCPERDVSQCALAISAGCHPFSLLCGRALAVRYSLAPLTVSRS
eukprot:scaffold706_cov418-Prasinococcus_capsulatus_cf.AAC.8